MGIETAIALQDIIGRQRELQTIAAHIRNRNHLHIHGAEGMGKSALLDRTLADWKNIGGPLVPVYSRSSRSLRGTLLNICGVLLMRFKRMESIDKFGKVTKVSDFNEFRGLNIRALKKMAFDYMARDNFCMVLDHLEHVTPRMHAFLTPLYEQALVITASRQSWVLDDYTFWGNLAYCLYLTPKLSVESLKKKDTFVFMEGLCGDLNLDIAGKQQVFEEVSYIAKGNMKMIRAIFEKARRPEYLRNNRPNLKLIMLDLEMESITIEDTTIP